MLVIIKTNETKIIYKNMMTKTEKTGLPLTYSNFFPDFQNFFQDFKTKYF